MNGYIFYGKRPLGARNHNYHTNLNNSIYLLIHILCSNRSLKKSDARFTASVLKQDQTHERFRRMLFIRTKHNMRIVGVIPFIKLQNDT